ncbi:MAG: fluoride efflux transporter CrcB [Paracoccaceae bacterium]|nr:fluoride efflux transporter CrcB [Paracoccaceae bacterium]
MMTSVISVAIGGALGAVLRYLIGVSVAFPFGTLTVNIVGSFCIGLAWVFLASKNPGLLPFVMTGILGGFTTFSTFSLDTLRLIEDGRLGFALAYVTASVVLSLAACFAALLLARSITA